MNKKKLKKRVVEITEEIKKDRDIYEKLDKDISTKKEDLNSIRNLIVSRGASLEETQKLNNNSELLDSIYSLYKTSVSFHNQNNNIDSNFDKINEQNYIKIRNLRDDINELKLKIKEKDELIFNTKKEIDKIVTRELADQIDVENHIINPTSEYINPISELSLFYQVKQRLKILIENTRKLNKEISSEIEEYKIELERLREENEIEIDKEEEENKANGEDNFEDESFELDSKGIDNKNFEVFIESPRFADKIVVKTQKIKPIKLEIENQPGTRELSLFKIKNTHDMIETLNEQIEITNRTIKELKSELDNYNKTNAIQERKKNKLMDNIKFAISKTEILQQQLKQKESI